MSTPPTAPAIRLLLADVDGTLVTQEKVLTDRAIAAVQKLHDAGIQFAITSGRPPMGMKMLIEPLKLTTPVAAFNGGLFVQPDLTTVIDQQVLPKELVPQIIDLMTAHKLTAWVYRGADWYIIDPKGPHVEREQKTVQFPPKIVANYDDLHDNVAKIVGCSDDLDAVAKAEADAQLKFGATSLAARSQPYYLDVTHPQANKGAVATRLVDMLKVPTEQIATIGDQPNDVLMFRKSGFSIAMGNASLEVQRSARRVTTSNSDEGFANAVEKFVLPRS